MTSNQTFLSPHNDIVKNEIGSRCENECIEAAAGCVTLNEKATRENRVIPLKQRDARTVRRVRRI